MYELKDGKQLQKNPQEAEQLGDSSFLSVEEVFGRPASLVGLKYLYGYVYYVIDLCKLFLIGISFFVIV